MTDQPPQDSPAKDSTVQRRQERAAAAKSGKGTTPRAGAETGRPDRITVPTRPDRYLVAVSPPADVRATSAQLAQAQSRRVVRSLSERGTRGGFPGVAVIELTPERAAMLAAYPGVRVEPDVTAGLWAQAPPAVATRRVTFEVLDDGLRPIEGATVTAVGPGLAATSLTGPDGRAELTATPEALMAALAVEVHPPRGCWPVRVNRPVLDPARPARVICTRVTTTSPDFPERALDSWGARAMGFDRLPPTYRGAGVRIALIDSGAATGHPDLSGCVEHGSDLIGQDTAKGWQEDLTGTGTHYAALIAGRDDGTGIVGLAPEAEVHVCRVAPGGTTASLIEALDYCIEHQVDVAMFGTCVSEPSALLSAKVEEAWRNGITCIASAGAADGPCWPGGLPQVLAVGAIGQLGTFPPDAIDTVTLTSQVTPEGLFAPDFGTAAPGLPGVDCCAPGIAVVSALPPASYGPLSGTGAAAAYVTALAALILAHHPVFRAGPGEPRVTRDAARPARVMEIIKGSSRPLPQLDPARIGTGIPDAAVALSIAPWGAHPPLSLIYPASVPSPDGMTPLEPLNAAMAAAGLLPAEPPV
jgi:hypothetical protein